MPGQNGEDRIILDYLHNIADDYPHRFLDVGGYDPVVFSNTRILVENGWSGVYVEPAPGNFNGFLREYHDNKDILLVNAAVTSESKLIEFWDSGGDAVSSAVPEHVAKWTVGHVKFRNYLTKTITWDELLDAANVKDNPISVLSLDVEAMNAELFQLLPIERLLPQLRVFIVEHDGQHELMKLALSRFNFKEHHFNGENIIFIR
jgi:FkbM family methyltransferase